MQFTGMEDLSMEEESLEQNFLHLKKKLFGMGYSDGVIAGQEYILQSSFNESFINSAKWFQNIAIFRGVFSALLLHLQKSSCPIDIMKKLENLVLKLKEFEHSEHHLLYLKESLLKEIAPKDTFFQPVKETFDESTIDILSESIREWKNINPIQSSNDSSDQTNPIPVLVDKSSKLPFLPNETKFIALKLLGNEVFELMNSIFSDLEAFLEISQYTAISAWLKNLLDLWM